MTNSWLSRWVYCYSRALRERKDENGVGVLMRPPGGPPTGLLGVSTNSLWAIERGGRKIG